MPRHHEVDPAGGWEVHEAARHLRTKLMVVGPAPGRGDDNVPCRDGHELLVVPCHFGNELLVVNVAASKVQKVVGPRGRVRDMKRL